MRRNDGRRKNQWNFDGYITYYALNRDEFKCNNLGLDLYEIIAGMWADFLK